MSNDLFYIRCLDRESRQNGPCCWWKENRQGYTFDLAQAGVYERAEAEEILRQANVTGPHEEMVPFACAQGAAKLIVEKCDI